MTRKDKINETNIEKSKVANEIQKVTILHVSLLKKSQKSRSAKIRRRT